MANILSTKVTPLIYKTSIRVFFFISSWIFFWLFYGDVLFQLQEQSFWFFASPSEFASLKVHLDYLTYISRFCLTIFAIPILGALVISAILSLIELLTDRIFNFKSSRYLLSFLPSIILMFVVCSHDMTIFYGHENSTVFKILLISLAVFLIVLPVSRFFKRNISLSGKETSLKTLLFNCSILFLMIFFAYLYSYRDKEFRTITSLKYYTEQKKWSKVASIAENSNIDNKVIAGYHAVALAQLGQIGDRLFKVGYNFPKQKTTSKVDEMMFGSMIANSDILFYGGIPQPSYHYAFEYFIIYGNYKTYLKKMARALVLNNDTVLADRMLTIIDRMPFEKDFVSRYRRFNQNPEEMKKDPELAPVLDLKQESDIFEQGFSRPLIANYYFRTSARGHTQRYQDLSLAACLYYKNLKMFSMKCSVLRKRNIIPKHFQEAVAMIAASTRDNEILQLYKVSPEVNASVNAFLQENSRHKNDADRGKKALESFKGTLMYYLTFENEHIIK